MEDLAQLLTYFAQERPVGTEHNTELLSWFEQRASASGYKIEHIPLDCAGWNHDSCSLCIADELYTILPSPYSLPFNGTLSMVFVSQAEQLSKGMAKNRLLVVSDSLAAKPIGDADLLHALEQTQASALLCLTSGHSHSGRSPFPLIAHATFATPSAYAPRSILGSLLQAKEDGLAVRFCIRSNRKQNASFSLLFKPKDIQPKHIVVTTRLDTKYGTKGALDRGASLVVLAALLERLGPTTSVYWYLRNGEAYDSREILALLPDSLSTQALVVDLGCIGLKDSKTTFELRGKWKANTALKSYLLAQGYVEVPVTDSDSTPILHIVSEDAERLYRLIDTQLDTVDQISLAVLEQLAEHLAHLVTQGENI